MSPRVASPVLLNGLAAAEHRLHKYMAPLTEADPPDPKTVAVEQTKRGLREQMEAAERRLWSKRTLLDQCEVLERRKIVEMALEREIVHALDSTRAGVGELRETVAAQFDELEAVLGRRREQILAQIESAELERVCIVEGALEACRAREETIDSMMDSVHQAANSDESLTELTAHLTEALNGPELGVGSFDPPRLDLSLDTSHAVRVINELQFLQHPSASAAAASMAHEWTSAGPDALLNERYISPEAGRTGLVECEDEEEQGWDPELPTSPSSSTHAGAADVDRWLMPPQVPTNLRVERIPAVSQEPQVFRVSWDPVEGATSYLMERQTRAGETCAEYFGLETQVDLRSATLGDMVRVRADNTIASSGWSEDMACIPSQRSP
eukprot:TRINITY_DN18315_c0_g1_i3.p1 TRINITY_DN18315_c0_g1~~TRINITY_DN18315_c0_g1_i3.p1  ORF type:complete len:383 (-),score=93.62 TRINITY_DN18315_c0_g1_i3:202-1350(-)